MEYNIRASNRFGISAGPEWDAEFREKGAFVAFEPGEHVIMGPVVWQSLSNLTVNAEGCVFFFENQAGFGFDGCRNVTWKGGKFVGGKTIETLQKELESNPSEGLDAISTGLAFSGCSRIRFLGSQFESFHRAVLIQKCDTVRFHQCEFDGVFSADVLQPAQNPLHKRMVRHHAGVLVNSSSQVRFDDCDFHSLGQGVLSGAIGGGLTDRLSIDRSFAKNMFDHGFYLSGRNISVTDTDVSKSYFGAGIQVRGSRNRIEGCRVSDSRLGISVTGDGVAEATGFNGRDTAVADNRIRSCSHGAIYLGAQDGAYPERFVIVRNIATDCCRENYAFSIFGGREHVIENNVSDGTAEPGFFIGDPKPTGPVNRGHRVIGNRSETGGLVRRVEDLICEGNSGKWTLIDCSEASIAQHETWQQTAAGEEWND